MAWKNAWPGVGTPLGMLTTLLLDGLVGLIAGAVVLAVVTLLGRIRSTGSAG